MKRDWRSSYFLRTNFNVVQGHLAVATHFKSCHSKVTATCFRRIWMKRRKVGRVQENQDLLCLRIELFDKFYERFFGALYMFLRTLTNHQDLPIQRNRYSMIFRHNGPTELNMLKNTSAKGAGPTSDACLQGFSIHGKSGTAYLQDLQGGSDSFVYSENVCLVYPVDSHWYFMYVCILIITIYF